MCINLIYQFGLNSQRFDGYAIYFFFATKVIAWIAFMEWQSSKDGVNFEIFEFVRSRCGAIILGVLESQNKNKCLNWFLGEEVVPVQSPAWLKCERKIVVTRRDKTQVFLAVPENFIIPVKQDFASLADVASYLAKCSETSPNDNDSTSESHDRLSSRDAAASSGIEITTNKPVVSKKFKIYVHGECARAVKSDSEAFERFLKTIYDCHAPIVVYVVKSPDLTQQNVTDLKFLKKFLKNSHVLLWHRNNEKRAKAARSSGDLSLFCPSCALNDPATAAAGVVVSATNRRKCDRGIAPLTAEQRSVVCNGSAPESALIAGGGGGRLLKQMEGLGFALCEDPHDGSFCELCANAQDYPESQQSGDYAQCFLHNCLCPAFQTPSNAVALIKTVAQQRLANAASALHRFHTSILDSVITQVFSLSRRVLITPKRIAYARCREQELYNKLDAMATDNQLEIMSIISSVKQECASTVLELVTSQDSEEDESGAVNHPTVTAATRNIQNLVLNQVKIAAADKLNNSINVLRDSVTGTLSRCLEHLEMFDDDGESEPGAAEEASRHLKMLLNAAYNVEFSIHSSSSLLRAFLDRMRLVIYSFSNGGANTLDAAWKRKTAEQVLNGLCEARLAKNMCMQFRSHLSRSHAAFVRALRQMELRIRCRLEKEEEEKHHVSKVLAPQIAQLALNSKSLLDELMHGMPKLGREIGRGVYGVVYSCTHWSAPITEGKKLAVKSVVPHDEKHWNDLALEFYYTICLPPHPRIVDLYGSVIDRNYGGHGSDQPAVFLIMEKMQRDLHVALKRGLREFDRIRVALDAVEGIRYLHSQGLVHRDIKLKNILLDQCNRAKISDLGFCKPCAMISGSIVGTPIHMPPELFTGQYDHSVDVYAFGILFWHLCAGTVRLPRNYRTCTTKDHLWTAVRQGARPERLPGFTDAAWSIMTECWDESPTRRPLPGTLHASLQHIMDTVPREAAH